MEIAALIIEWYYKTLSKMTAILLLRMRLKYCLNFLIVCQQSPEILKLLLLWEDTPLKCWRFLCFNFSWSIARPSEGWQISHRRLKLMKAIYHWLKIKAGFLYDLWKATISVMSESYVSLRKTAFFVNSASHLSAGHSSSYDCVFLSFLVCNFLGESDVLCVWMYILRHLLGYESPFMTRLCFIS